ncbi:MAG: AI-2E family transporter [Flavobacteriaceae bacterium]|nr:AI-2E family transporter [Flavobacteriaceae bacterium]
MLYKNISKGIIRAALISISFILIALFLYKITSVIVYITIAAIISLIGSPLKNILNKKLKINNTIAVFITISLFIFIIIAVLGLFIPLIIQQGENISLLDFNKLKEDLSELFVISEQYLSKYNLNLVEFLKNMELSPEMLHISEFVNAIIGGLGNLSIALFSIVFISFFFLKDSNILKDSLVLTVNEQNKEKLLKSLVTIKNLLSRYFIGLVLQITLLFIIYTITLSIFGINNAIAIAFLCSLLNLIPYVGPLIGAFIMLILSMTSDLSLDFNTQILPTTSYVMTGYFIAQIIDNFISQPIIFSKSVKSHPLEIFLIIIIGGILFGIIGMMVAVPFYTVVKVILKTFFSKNKIVKSLTKQI